MSYKHFSQTERYQIYSLIKAGHLPAKIAQLLGRHKSSISRELSRNTGNRGSGLNKPTNVTKSEASRVVLLVVSMKLPGRWLLSG